MRLSWNWLSEMVDLGSVGGPRGLAELLTRRGLEVEAIESQDAGLAQVVTGRILQKGQHPQADRLSLCKVTLGSGEPLEIVCGAQNHKSGDVVVVAQVGAHLPNGLKIAPGKIRGVVSNGMLCSESELGLKEESEGILILPQDTPLGRPIAEVLGRTDHILTLKITANRADCLSHWGIAREVSAALGKKPCRPEPKVAWDVSKLDALPRTGLEAGELGPQFFGCRIEGVKIGPSPEWMVKRLEAVGARSINNVVDATNLVMFELGQPVHAYDAALLSGASLVIREARAGEQLPLLDGSVVTLSGKELVIADDAKAVALAGVMGGGNSEVSESTSAVFLEVAQFDPTTVRKASSSYQKKTEASHRFERGVDSQGLEFAMRRLAGLVLQTAGGKIVGTSTARRPAPQPRRISIDSGYCANFLGMAVQGSEVEQVLRSLGCELESRAGGWNVIPPSFRLDLSIPEDLAEEVARCVGFERIPSEVPMLTDMPTSQAGDARFNARAWIDGAKDRLVGAGFHETVNFSFTSTKWLQELALAPTVKVMNPLSEEHEWMVPSLLPGLLANVLHNTRHRFGSESQPIRICEIRPTFHATGPVAALGEDKTGVQEKWRLSFVMSGPRFAQALRNEEGEVDFYDGKAVFERLMDGMGGRGMRLQPLSASRGGNALAHLVHPGQAAEVLAGNQVAGVIGMLHPKFARAWKLRAPLFIAELDFDALVRMARGAGEGRTFASWPEFPGMERDFALVVKNEVSAEKLTAIALKAGRPLAKVAKIFDVYRGPQVGEGMTSIAVRVIFGDDTRSLQEAETEEVSKKIVEAWRKEAGAELRG
jgi:phenylalanyl-tRNA synthetase beta chain